MQIIAKRGSSQFLVTDSTDKSDINPPSKIVDINQKIATAMPAQQALKWGYWEEPGDIDDSTRRQVEAIAAGGTRLQQVANLIKVGG